MVAAIELANPSTDASLWHNSYVTQPTSCPFHPCDFSHRVNDETSYQALKQHVMNCSQRPTSVRVPFESQRPHAGCPRKFLRFHASVKTTPLETQKESWNRKWTVHLRRCNLNPKNIQNEADGLDKQPCPRCGIRLGERGLREHLRDKVCDKESSRPFHCDFCNKGYKTSEIKRLHENKHCKGNPETRAPPCAGCGTVYSKQAAVLHARQWPDPSVWSLPLLRQSRHVDRCSHAAASHGLQEATTWRSLLLQVLRAYKCFRL